MAESSDFTDDTRRQRVREFLEENHVEAGWQAWIMSKDRVWRALADSIQELDRQTPYIPSWENILAAFRYCPPSKVKVVLLGHDPIPDGGLATGVAFSFPEGTKEVCVNKPSMNALHAVLRRVYPDSPPRAETSCCHLNWAMGGALLLNTALTYTDKWSQGNNKNIWIGFIKALLQELLREAGSSRVFLFWGTFADEVYRYLMKSKRVPLGNNTLFHGHHPTYPKEEEENQFASQAIGQFIHIKERWPDNPIFTLDLADDDGSEEIVRMMESAKLK